MPELEARALGARRNLVELAAAKHGELFIALGQIDAQRERVTRQADELRDVAARRADVWIDAPPAYGD